jgi:phosphatidylinositol alpha 1,6-mannosyltransferase
MNGRPRVAFLTDSLGEVNGVARTSRSLVAYAARHDLPMLCVYGARSAHVATEGSTTRVALERSRVGFGLESDLRFDLLFWRHRQTMARLLSAFQPDVVHITGPSDVGQLGAYLAHVTDIPLVASWHTNVHDYAALRLGRMARILPEGLRCPLIAATRRRCLDLALDFYRIPRRVLAPNPELVTLIREVTGRPVHLMPRGVDTEQFAPAWAAPRPASFRIGYVGRLSPEKNVRLLARIERGLIERRRSGFRIVVVGDGSERAWLEQHLAHAEFTGVLHGPDLARAYANMDVLVFPSETDTFGNVVLEALASGTPVVAADAGGPRYIVRPWVSGHLASTPGQFVDAVESMLAADAGQRAAMRLAARQQALQATWERTFEGVYDVYRQCIEDASRPETAPTRPSLAGRLVRRTIRSGHAHSHVAAPGLSR